MRETLGEPMGRMDWTVAMALNRDTRSGLVGLHEVQQASRVLMNRSIPDNILTKCPGSFRFATFSWMIRITQRSQTSRSMMGNLRSVTLIRPTRSPLSSRCNSARVACTLHFTPHTMEVNCQSLQTSLACDVWAFSNPRFLCDELWENLEVAQAYVQTIEQHANMPL